MEHIVLMLFDEYAMLSSVTQFLRRSGNFRCCSVMFLLDFAVISGLFFSKTSVLKLSNLWPVATAF